MRVPPQIEPVLEKLGFFFLSPERTKELLISLFLMAVCFYGTSFVAEHYVLPRFSPVDAPEIKSRYPEDLRTIELFFKKKSTFSTLARLKEYDPGLAVIPQLFKKEDVVKTRPQPIRKKKSSPKKIPKITISLELQSIIYSPSRSLRLAKVNGLLLKEGEAFVVKHGNFLVKVVIDVIRKDRVRVVFLNEAREESLWLKLGRRSVKF